MSKVFEVTLNGETFHAERPKARVYRQLIRLQEKYGEVNLMSKEEVYDAYLDLAVDAFANPAVTKERIEDEMHSDELIQFLTDAITLIQGAVADKSEQLPKSKNAGKSN